MTVHNAILVTLEIDEPIETLMPTPTMQAVILPDCSAALLLEAGASTPSQDASAVSDFSEITDRRASPPRVTGL